MKSDLQYFSYRRSNFVLRKKQYVGAKDKENVARHTYVLPPRTSGRMTPLGLTTLAKILRLDTYGAFPCLNSRLIETSM